MSVCIKVQKAKKVNENVAFKQTDRLPLQLGGQQAAV